MLIEVARRAEAAVKEMLAITDEGDGVVLRSCVRGLVGRSPRSIDGDERSVPSLGRGRRWRAGSVTATAALKCWPPAAGLSRHEARSQVKTAEALSKTPRSCATPMAGGRVSTALTPSGWLRLSRRPAPPTSNQTAELLAKAETMRPEDFGREARRWAVERQGDNGESEHARQRARRRVRAVGRQMTGWCIFAASSTP